MLYIILSILYSLKWGLEDKPAARRAVILIQVIICILYFTSGGLELMRPSWLLPADHEFLMFLV